MLNLDNLQIPRNLKVPITILFALALVFNFYLMYRAATSDTTVYPVSLLLIFLGIVYESFRFFENKKNVLYIFLAAYIVSLIIALMPGENEKNYNFDFHLQSWPYFFVGVYALIFAMIYRDQAKIKLTEGITLLQSLSIIYWIVDYGFMNFHTGLEISLLTIVLLFSAFSALNALTYIRLSEFSRVVLSIWSSIVMLVFAADNIIRVFSNPDIENSIYLPDKLHIGLQYFLLGTSAVYAMYNFMLLVDYIPSKNREYSKDLQENNKEHLSRYSENQVFIGYSLLCIFYALTLFGLNYTYRILPRHTMIWFVFFTFPLILKAIDLVKNKNLEKQDKLA